MIRYYISGAYLNAKKLAEAARQHWHVEIVTHAQISAQGKRMTNRLMGCLWPVRRDGI